MTQDTTEYYIEKLSWTRYLWLFKKVNDEWDWYVIRFYKNNKWEKFRFSWQRTINKATTERTKKQYIKKFKLTKLSKEEIFLILL